MLSSAKVATAVAYVVSESLKEGAETEDAGTVRKDFEHGDIQEGQGAETKGGEEHGTVDRLSQRPHGTHTSHAKTQSPLPQSLADDARQVAGNPTKEEGGAIRGETEDYPAPGDVDEEPALPPYLCAEDEEPSQRSTCFSVETATSFTSSFSQSQAGSKRTRPSRSPPQPSKKHSSAKETRKNVFRQATGSPLHGSTSLESKVPPQPALAEE